MGLASKLQATQGMPPVGAGYPPAAGLPTGSAGASSGANPPYPTTTKPAGYGQPQTAPYGAPPGQQPSYGQPPSQYSQQPGKYGASSSTYGQQPSAPYGQQSSNPAYGQPPNAPPYGQQPSAPYGQNTQVPYGQQNQSPYGQPSSSVYGQQPPYGNQSSQYGHNSYGQYGPGAQAPVPYGQKPTVYGAAAGGVAAGGAMGAYGSSMNSGYGAPAMASNYLHILQQAVQENQLQAFYPPGSLEPIAGRIGGQIDQISQYWRIPREIAGDLVRLALYDVVLYLDDSGSMSFEENGERIDDLKLIMSRVAYAVSLFDSDGIEIRFMNSQISGSGIRSEADALRLLDGLNFSGMTPLGTNLEKKVISPLFIGPLQSGQLRKPVLVIAITDGQPAGESADTVFRTIRHAKRACSQSRYGPNAIAFQFAQVGNDVKAREFLAKLDTDPEVGRYVDCTSNFEVEQDEMARLGVSLTPETWLVKLLMGAIDKSYDSQDERR
ncbi:hypothetical protein V1511DRAFT_503134 [Dipodascopsis uninucleata]